MASVFHKPRRSVTRALKHFRNRRSVIAITLFVCCAGFVAVAVRAYSGLKSESSSAGASARQVSSPAPGAFRGPVQVVRFTLYDVGIYPREAYASQGMIALSFEDISGGSGELVVEREAGLTTESAARVTESVGRVFRTGGKARGRNDLNLSPGRYQVYPADHPDNRATLIVEP